jgi:hypothetical protein
MAPSRDLWAGIAAGIETPVVYLKSRATRAPAPRAWRMAAAAVVLMAVSSGLTYVLATGDQRSAIATDIALDSGSVPTPVASTTPRVVTPRPTSGSGSTVLIRSEPSGPEVMYAQEITRLRTILDQRRADLDTATVSAVEKSLRAIDQAIIDARAALVGNTGSRFLNDQLNRSLEKKLGVLRRVALLPVGAS